MRMISRSSLRAAPRPTDCRGEALPWGREMAILVRSLRVDLAAPIATSPARRNAGIPCGPPARGRAPGRGGWMKTSQGGPLALF